MKSVRLNRAMREVSRLVVWCALTTAAYGQGQPLDARALDVIYSLKQGSYGPVTEAQIAEAQGGRLVPILEELFLTSHDADVKGRIASTLMRLGDKDITYWNFLVEQATPALESDAPSPRCLDACVSGLSPEYSAWAKAHNVSAGSPTETALYGLWGKLDLLASADDPRGIPLLRKALQSPNYEIESIAAHGLAEIHDKDSIPLIIAACRKAPAMQARILAGSLKLFDDPRAQSAADMYLPKPVDPIEALRQDDDLSLSGHNLERVADAHTVQAIPILQKKFALLQDANDKAHIASVLVRLGDKGDIYWDFLVREAKAAVESDAPPIVGYDSHGKVMQGPSPEFIAWAKAHNVSVDSAVEDAMIQFPSKVVFLAMTGDPRGIPVLRQAMSSSNFMVQAYAAQGLAKLRDEDSIPLIIEACKSAPADAATAIAEPLVYFDDPRAQSAATQYLPKEMLAALREKKQLHGSDPFH